MIRKVCPNPLMFILWNWNHMYKDAHLYGTCVYSHVLLQLWRCSKLWKWSQWIIGQWSVLLFLFFVFLIRMGGQHRGPSMKWMQFMGRMPLIWLLNIGIASSSESEICGNGFYPNATPVCHWWEDCQTECAVWKIVVSSFVSELNMSRSVLDLLTK